MRNSVKVSSGLVVVLVLTGCSPDEPQPTAVQGHVPPGLSQEPVDRAQLEVDRQMRESGSGASQAQLNQIRDSGPVSVQSQAQFVCETIPGRPSVGCIESPQAPRRLVFECTDGVAFAVRMNERSLVLYPPGFPPNGSLVLNQVPSEPGVVRYQISDIEFQSRGDVATLEMGRERYADCVANPAASAWQDPTPRTSTR